MCKLTHRSHLTLQICFSKQKRKISHQPPEQIVCGLIRYNLLVDFVVIFCSTNGLIWVARNGPTVLRLSTIVVTGT
jgi:hypothetical protein